MFLKFCQSLWPVKHNLHLKYFLKLVRKRILASPIVVISVLGVLSLMHNLVFYSNLILRFPSNLWLDLDVAGGVSDSGCASTASSLFLCCCSCVVSPPGRRCLLLLSSNTADCVFWSDTSMLSGSCFFRSPHSVSRVNGLNTGSSLPLSLCRAANSFSVVSSSFPPGLTQQSCSV